MTIRQDRDEEEICLIRHKTVVPLVPMTDKHMITGDYLQAIFFDSETISKVSASQLHEREVVVYDILQSNHFKVVDGVGPFNLLIKLRDSRVVLEVSVLNRPHAVSFYISWNALRRFFKNYEATCNLYHNSIKSRPPTDIEAIDMGRRAIHNEGATYIQEHLRDGIVMDFETARALYSLFYTLHWKG